LIFLFSFARSGHPYKDKAYSQKEWAFCFGCAKEHNLSGSCHFWSVIDQINFARFTKDL